MINFVRSTQGFLKFIFSIFLKLTTQVFLKFMLSIFFKLTTEGFLKIYISNALWRKPLRNLELRILQKK